MRALTLCAVLLALCGGTRSKVYERCELARELAARLQVPLVDTATWVCIAYHESRLNTASEGRLNGDGSHDHGLLQISELYWCKPDWPGGACGLQCSSLRDEDLEDDLRCALQIHREHEGLSGDGYTAWSVYRPNCQGKNVKKYTAGCDTGLDAINFKFDSDRDSETPLVIEPYSSPLVPTYRPLPTIANIDQLLPITKTTTTERQPEYTIKPEYTKYPAYSYKPEYSKPDREEVPVYTKVHDYSHLPVYIKTPDYPREPILNVTLSTDKPTEPPRLFITQTTKIIPTTEKVYSTSVRPITTTQSTTTKYYTTPSTRKENPITQKYVPYYFPTTQKTIPTVASTPRPTTKPSLLITQSKFFSTRPVFNFQTKKPIHYSYTPFTTPKSSTSSTTLKPYNTIRVQMFPASVTAINKPAFNFYAKPNTLNTLPDKPSPYFTRFSMKVSSSPFKETQKSTVATPTTRNKLITSFKPSPSPSLPVKFSTQSKNPFGKVVSSSYVTNLPVSQSVVNSVFHGEKAKYTAFDPFGVFRYY